MSWKLAAWVNNPANTGSPSGSGGSGYGPNCNPNLTPGTAPSGGGSNILPACIPIMPLGGGLQGAELALITGKFTMTSADQASYPRFTAMVKGLEDFVKKDARVMEALKHYSGFTEAQILDKVKFGSGPRIKITDFSPGSKSIGQYNRMEPGILRVRDTYVHQLDATNL